MPRQHETDLRFIQRMARRNGYVFYIEPLTLGATTAYFGPENRLGLPQPALSIDMGTATNVKSLSFTNDALAPVGAKGSFVEPITKTSIPIPPLPSLRVPPLAASPAAARRTTLMRQTASQNPGQAATTALAADDQRAGCGDRHRPGGHGALRQRAAGAPAGGRARRGSEERRHLLRQPGDARDRSRASTRRISP